MTAAAIPRPQTDEYATYYGNYIRKVPEGDLLALLAAQIGDTLRLLRGIPEARGRIATRPANGASRKSSGT